MSDLSAIHASSTAPVSPQDVYAHLVIDMQRGYVSGLPEHDQITLPEKIESFISKISPFMKTIVVGVEDEEMLNFGSEEARNWSSILKSPDGGVLPIDHYKRGNSAFKFQTYHTVSDATPKGLLTTGANHLVISGINKSACVADTALDAIERGYKVTILDDLTADSKHVGQTSTPGIQKCIEAGVRFCTADDFLNHLNLSRKPCVNAPAPTI